MLMNLCVSAERGAASESTQRIWPPKIACTFLTTMKFYKIFSRPYAPNQPPLTALKLQRYAISNSFLVKPPFASTWNLKQKAIRNYWFARTSYKTFLETPPRTRSSIAGTAAINVGLKTEASPFVPLFILFDVSVIHIQ